MNKQAAESLEMMNKYREAQYLGWKEHLALGFACCLHALLQMFCKSMDNSQVLFKINNHGREGNEKYARYFDEDILELTDDFLEKFGF